MGSQLALQTLNHDLRTLDPSKGGGAAVDQGPTLLFVLGFEALGNDLEFED